MEISAIFWDLGGVVLTNGWDREQRAGAVERFGLDPEDFEDRHREIVSALETGRTDLAGYLRATVFYEPRPFSEADFREYMHAQSEAYPGSLEVLDLLRASGRYLLATLNNESHDLNECRIENFALRRRFDVFFTSAFLRLMKPDPQIYRAALDITQRRPEEVLFVDDRPQNLEPAKALGMRTLHYRGEEGPEALLRGLAGHGIRP